MPANNLAVSPVEYTKADLTNFDLLAGIYKSGIAKTFNLKSSTVNVLIGLCDHYNNKTGVVFPSIDYLCKKLNLSKQTAINCLKELQTKRITVKIKSGKHNKYAFTHVFLTHF